MFSGERIARNAGNVEDRSFVKLCFREIGFENADFDKSESKGTATVVHKCCIIRFIYRTGTRISHDWEITIIIDKKRALRGYWD
jgi:hypothetical protein